MELAEYKACICEGAAENAIMDILLDNNLMILSRTTLMILVTAIKKYHEISKVPKGEYTLMDLLQ